MRKIKKQKASIDFVFIDETGIAASTPTQPYFGVGIFITGKTTLLNKELHDVLVKALSTYKITKDKFEFKFSSISKTNLTFYKKIIAILTKYKKDWAFSAIIENKEQASWTQDQLWENYLGKIIKILSRKKSKAVIIADYLSKPNIAKMDFDSLLVLHQILATLQLESQGSLLLQVADILLGALAFQLKNGERKVKKTISSEILRLLKDKKMRVTEVTSSPATYFYTTLR